MLFTLAGIAQELEDAGFTREEIEAVEDLRDLHDSVFYPVLAQGVPMLASHPAMARWYATRCFQLVARMGGGWRNASELATLPREAIQRIDELFADWEEDQAEHGEMSVDDALERTARLRDHDLHLHDPQLLRPPVIPHVLPPPPLPPALQEHAEWGPGGIVHRPARVGAWIPPQQKGWSRW